MKKLFALFFSLFLLALSAGESSGAALTLSSRIDGACGSFRCVTGTVTANSGDTLAIGLGTVVFVGMQRNDNATDDHYGASVSGGTITFYLLRETSGAQGVGATFRLFVIGF